MGEAKGENRLQQQLRSPVLYRVTGVLFALVLFTGFALVLFNNQKTFYPYTLLQLVLCMAAGVLVVYQLLQLFIMLPTPKGGVQALVAVMLFAVLIFAQIYIGGQLRVQPDTSWSFGSVYERASEYVLNKKQLPDDYFLHNPQDMGLYTLFCLLFRMFNMWGARDFLVPAMVLNFILMDLAVLLVYLSAKSAFGFQRSTFFLVLALLTLPLYLYVPIFCVESLTMVVPAAMVYLWLKARRRWRECENNRALWRFCQVTLVAAVGALINPLVLPVWFAVLLDLLVLLAGKGKAKIAMIGTLLLVVVMVAGIFGMLRGGLLPEYDFAEKAPPLNRWVLAGLEDHSAGLSAPATELSKAQQAEANSEAISAYFDEKGFLGYMGHLGNKLSYLLGDGTYFAPETLKSAPMTESSLHNYIVPYQKGFTAVAIVSLVFQSALLFWGAISALLPFLRGNDYFSFIRNATLLVLLFALFFAASPRTLLFVLPLMMLSLLEVGPVQHTKPKPKSATQPASSQRGETALELSEEELIPLQMEQMVALRQQRNKEPDFDIVGRIMADIQNMDDQPPDTEASLFDIPPDAVQNAYGEPRKNDAYMFENPMENNLWAMADDLNEPELPQDVSGGLFDWPGEDATTARPTGEGQGVPTDTSGRIQYPPQDGSFG